MSAHLGIARMEAATHCRHIATGPVHGPRRPLPDLRPTIWRLGLATLAFATVGALMISDQIAQPEMIHRPNGSRFTMRFEQPPN